MATPVLKVKIVSPTQTIFDGEALSLSSVNSAGKFDILPYHANFITLVQKNPIILRVKKNGTEGIILSSKPFDELFKKNAAQLRFDFDTAIIYTKDNMVKIYTNIQPQF